MNDQYILAVFIAGTTLITIFAVMMTVFLVIHKQKQNRAKLERQQLEHQYRSTLLRTRIEMQEQALNFVSTEIHDNIGQVLSFTSKRLAQLHHVIPDTKTRAMLDENVDALRNAVKELRVLSHTLNTGMVEKRQLEEVIEMELSRIRAFSAIKCDLVIDGHVLELNPEVRLLVFRIIQEALQNVVKHAEAKSVVIKLSYNGEKLQLRIIDDGKGLDPQQIGNNASLGMQNMHQRANLLRGSLEVSSNGKSGTEIALTVPI